VDETAATITWLQELGVLFTDATTNMPSGKRTYHIVKGRGAAVVNNAVSLVVQGYGNRIMLSYDSIFLWLGWSLNPPPHFADWYPSFLFKKLIPKMKAAGVTDELIKSILVDNLRRFFGGK
jgi:predicted metal-dependent phosphotriesterase family hydrolase